MNWKLALKAIEDAKKNGSVISDDNDFTVGDWDKMTDEQKKKYEKQ